MTIRKSIDAVLELLAERFPRAFFMHEAHRRPLKVGIRDDIVAAIGDAIEPKLLGATLKFYCCNIAYRAAQLESALRIDLNGEVAGTVSEKDALSAARSVILAKAALRDRKRSEPRPEIVPVTEPAIEPAPPPPPKRLGLADLRAAAQRRKAEVA